MPRSAGRAPVPGVAAPVPALGAAVPVLGAAVPDWRAGCGGAAGEPVRRSRIGVRGAVFGPGDGAGRPMASYVPGHSQSGFRP